MKSYLLLYDDDCGSEKEIIDFIDNQSIILNWHTALPSSVFIVSNKSLSILSKFFQKELNEGMFVLILLNDSQIDGLLPPDTWEFIVSPKTYEDDE
jgi:hypothetical protein